MQSDWSNYERVRIDLTVDNNINGDPLNLWGTYTFVLHVFMEKAYIGYQEFKFDLEILPLLVFTCATPPDYYYLIGNPSLTMETP